MYYIYIGLYDEQALNNFYQLLTYKKHVLYAVIEYLNNLLTIVIDLLLIY